MSFNSSCDYAKAACKTATASLVNYLTITLCMFQYRAQPLGFVLLALWLVFLIALLATVVDGFFVPPLVMLSEKLRLPPNVAGMTLMAVGNDRMDFMRDIVAYLIVMSSVVIVAVDGKVHLLEAVLLPVAYLVYILTVIVINYIQKSRDPIVVNSSKQSVIVPGLTWDGRWSQWHYTFAVLSPLPIALLLLTASKGWEGYVIFVGPIPLVVILAIVGVVLSVLLLLILSPQKSPHWTLQIVLILAAFATSITWLNIIANEIISILQTFGILFDINTAILGLTILAAGNSMADLVADTVIARAGKPEMAFACCFGSPLLSNVLGLSIAFTVKISLGNNGDPYQIDIQNTDYSQVKLSWIFLGASLLLTVAFFPIFKFNPPRAYGAVLIALYMVFLMFCLLTAVNVIPLSV
eukprot:Em0020g658a